MKTLILISWRNLWRQKRRSLIVILSVGLGIFAMILSIGLLNGMINQAVENTISTSIGHIAIHQKGFQDTMKLEYNFLPARGIEKIIMEENYVSSYAPRLKVQAMVRSAEASRGVLVYGIDPEKEKTISKISDYTIKEDGGAFLDSPSEGSILISKSMAKKLDLLIGDKLVLMIQDKNNEIVGIGMTVKGFFQTPVDSFDKFVVFAGMRKMQEITGLDKNITEINILLKDKKDVDAVKKLLISKIGNPDLEILTWKDMVPNLVSAVKFMDAMMYIFFSIIFITVIFSIANTLVMAIMERFHEIGVMKSIGTRPSWIFFIVIFEAVNLGLIGLAAGVSMGTICTMVLSNVGLDFSFFIESMRMWGTGSIIYPSIKTMDIVMATVIVMSTTIVAALYPAVKAARIKPLEALNYV
ncbi:MAG: ABC transporter permease [Spirochaetes bacterium]|nr:ABC transporter permease [Spirochaetota bacterium]